jgi:phosphotransferase system enzyme I (PtsI)
MSLEKKGIAVSHGFITGHILLLNQARTIVDKKKIKKTEIYEEINRLQLAVEKSIDEISELKINSDYGLKSEHIDILDFNILILEDEILASEVIQKIKKEQINAEWALNSVLTDKSKNFSNVKDIYMQERLADFYYIGERIIKNLRGNLDFSLDFEKDSIIVAHDLSPVDALKYCQDKNVIGLLTDVGGITSHTAIIARSLSLPAIMSLVDISQVLEPGNEVVVDGYKGLVSWNLKDDEKKEILKLKKEYSVLEENLLEFSKLPSLTKDGVEFLIKANIEIASETSSAIRYGAQGIGMYRTEFLFTSKDRFPSENEQYEDYIKLFSNNDFNDITIRTLDIGGDKLIHKNDDEANPAMGLRGIRYSLSNIEIFKNQIKAIFRVCSEKKKKIRILLPMVSTLEEIIEAKKLIESMAKEFDVDDLYNIGVVIETPSAAIMVNEISHYVNFLSIGTNDLIQYILAADRNNKELRPILNYYQPAVIRTISDIVTNSKEGTYISVCGEMASDILSLPLFIGLGINELSMNCHSIPIIKSAINELEKKDCENILYKCIKKKKSSEISTILKKEILRKVKKAKKIIKYEF